MGTSNLSLLTHEIIVVTQPKSTENNLKILTNTHIPRENKWTIYSRLSRLFLRDTDVLRYGFHKCKERRQCWPRTSIIEGTKQNNLKLFMFTNSNDFCWFPLWSNINSVWLMIKCLPAAKCPHPLASRRVPVRRRWQKDERASEWTWERERENGAILSPRYLPWQLNTQYTLGRDETMWKSEQKGLMMSASCWGSLEMFFIWTKTNVKQN